MWFAIQDGLSPLMVSAQKGSLSLVNALLQGGATVNSEVPEVVVVVVIYIMI